MDKIDLFYKNVRFLIIIGLIVFWTTSSTGVFLSNLNEDCFQCLCHVSTGCDFSHDCTGGYCGMFNISRVYWVDAGKPTLSTDNVNSINAWPNCVKDYACAKNTIIGYMQKYGRDCNSDGVTNCFDYMLVNGNGGFGCVTPLNRSANGRRWLMRFDECQLS